MKKIFSSMLTLAIALTMASCGGNTANNGREAAGQTVDHFHVHIIPRYANAPTKDAMTIESGTIEKPDFDALKEAITKAF